MTTAVIDTNIVIRFFLNDDPLLSAKARKIFEEVQRTNSTIYIDELIVAEIIWLMLSFYKKEKQEIVSLLQKLLSQKWMINPRKELILITLTYYSFHNVSYIDTWTLMVARSKNLPLVTFDKTLDKLAHST